MHSGRMSCGHEGVVRVGIGCIRLYRLHILHIAVDEGSDYVRMNWIDASKNQHYYFGPTHKSFCSTCPAKKLAGVRTNTRSGGSMAQTVSAFFPLPALGLDHSRHDVPSLPVISPRFSLPLLDEHASGEERIMAGLRGLSRYQVLHEDQMRQEEVGVLGVQNKGKGRAIEVEEEREDGLLDEDEDGRYAFWIRAGGKGEAGPSRPRIFKVCRALPLIS